MLKDPSHLDFMCFYRFSTVLHSFDIRHWRCAGCHYLITFATIHRKKSLFHESGNVIFWRIMPISETIYIDSHLPRAFSLLWYGFSLSTASKQFSPTKNHGGIARDVTMAKLIRRAISVGAIDEFITLLIPPSCFNLALDTEQKVASTWYKVGLRHFPGLLENYCAWVEVC